MGVFYTESPASRALCAKSRAETFELLVLNTSIIRPASNRYIRIYLERLHGAPYEPLASGAARHAGGDLRRDGLPGGRGERLRGVRRDAARHRRRAPEVALQEAPRQSTSPRYAEEFFAGAVALGRDPETIKRVWEMIMSFAGYSFCKGHSASYIQVAQHSCYLRAHYPAEFMAAVLANGGGFYAPFAYVAEAMRMGLTVLPPDVNASELPLHRAREGSPDRAPVREGAQRGGGGAGAARARRLSSRAYGGTAVRWARA